MSIEFILVVVLVFFVLIAWYIRLQANAMEYQALLEKMLNKFIFLRIEPHNGSQIAYNAVTEEFVCQGKDIKELNDNFGKRFPGSKGIIVESNSTEIVK